MALFMRTHSTQLNVDAMVDYEILKRSISWFRNIEKINASIVDASESTTQLEWTKNRIMPRLAKRIP